MPDLQVQPVPKAGRRVIVEAPYGRLVHEVRLTFQSGRWSAWIVTLPSQTWLAPDGRAALTFDAATEEEAERRAAAFIECECVARGHRLLGPKSANPTDAPHTPARRVVVEFPLRFLRRGRTVASMPRLVRQAVTANVSETGLFIATDEVLTSRARISIDLKLPERCERLEGEVVWSRVLSIPGRPAGMGIRLLDPTPSYRSKVRGLGQAGPGSGATRGVGGSPANDPREGS